MGRSAGFFRGLGISVEFALPEAGQNKSMSGALLPLGRRAEEPAAAGESPSRRPCDRPVAPPSAQSQPNNPALAASAPVTVLDAPRNFDVPPPPHSAFRLLLSSLITHHSHTHLAIRSGKSNQFGRRKCNPPGRRRGTDDLARSDHPTTTGDPAPPVLFSRPPQPRSPAPHGTRPVLAANQVTIFVYGSMRGSITKNTSFPCPYSEGAPAN